MALDVQRISLDISKQPTPQQVRLGQGDANATTLIVDVFDEGIAYDLTGYSVRLSMRLPNDGGYYDVDGTRDGNVATFDVDESYAASTAGVNGFGYVDVMDGDTVICSTSRFQLVVLQNASDGVELSPQYSDAVQDAIDRANAAAEAAEGVVLQDVPLMSATVRGGAQLGSGLAIADGKLSVDASTVAVGALPVSHGGTGSTSAADARTALGVTPSNIGAAAASHEHGAADITSGVIPIAHGGTGADTADGARNNLNVVACNNQSVANALLANPTSSTQIWELRATGANSNNTTAGTDRVGLIVQNTSLAAYDYTSGSTLWTLEGAKSTVTTVSYIFSAITQGITITSATFTSRNGVAQLTFIARGFSGTGAKSIGTLNAAYRPASDVVGGTTARYVSHTEITSAGAVSSYWETATSSTANTFTFSYTYLL